MIFKASAADRSADQALIAEISPAMMQKLHGNWRQSGTAFGLLFLFGGFHLIGQTKPFALFSENWLTIFGVLNLLLGASALCMAHFGRSLAVYEELKYRRVHGKWRWER
jgi:hypothetical protein